MDGLFLGLILGLIVGVIGGFRWGKDVGAELGAGAWRDFVIWQLRRASAEGRLDEARIKEIFEMRDEVQP